MTSTKCKKGAACTCIKTIDQQIDYYSTQSSCQKSDEPLTVYVDEVRDDFDDFKNSHDWVLGKYKSYLMNEALFNNIKGKESNLIGYIAVMYAAEIVGKLGLGTLANDLNLYALPFLRKKVWSDRHLKASSNKGSISIKDEQRERQILVIEGMKAAFIESNNKNLRFKSMLKILEKNGVLKSSYSDGNQGFFDVNENKFSERTIRRIFNSVRVCVK
ncbi:hypothetical protein [Shewanella baltica]|uniref:hypothetical protein n=1 Tax=Shewanella baltica TaxID=62322 RepID=UPI00217D5734|nr:hypothetical protein [Shewanella baltica]MCS6162234.1 hypothetical protein [Shewanella baltica]